MKAILIKWTGCLAAVFLAGCVGTNFKRPAPSELVLGTTTASEIKARFSTPLTKAEMHKNGVTIVMLSHAFTTMDWGSLKPARGQSYYFWEDKLVGFTFLSSFKDDTTDFDDTKVGEIKKGVSNRSDVEKLFGPPGGRSIYPLAPSRDEEAVIYMYSRTRGVPFGVKVYNKSLTVAFNRDGIVTDVEYLETGEK